MKRDDEVYEGVFDAFREEMSRAMHQLGFSPRMPAFLHPSVWRPPTDVFETRSDIVVRMDIAGTCREDIDIVFSAGMLVIRGVRHEEPPFQKTAVSRMEIDYGPFEQRISLPQEINVEKIEAVYADGFLTITVPKSAKARTQAICIRIKG
jgi:HSP20 family protein